MKSFSLKKSLPLFLTGVLLVVLAFLLGWSSLFTTKSIDVVGAPNVEIEELIQGQAGITVGTKLARIDARAITRRFESQRWIQSIEVRRNWLQGIVQLEVIAKEPIALFLQSGEQIQAIDATGDIFVAPTAIKKNLPTIYARNSEQGASAVELYRGMPKPFFDDIASLESIDGRLFSLEIRVPQKVVDQKVVDQKVVDQKVVDQKAVAKLVKITWGRDEEAELKVRVIGALLDLPENKRAKLIDVSAPHAPIVR